MRRLAEAGVTDVIVGFRWPYSTGPDTEPLEHKLAALRRLANDVIANRHRGRLAWVHVPGAGRRP